MSKSERTNRMSQDLSRRKVFQYGLGAGVVALAGGSAWTASVQAQTSQDDPESVSLQAEDGRNCSGVLHLPPNRKPKTVVIAFHPRGNSGRHFALLALAKRGIAGLGMAGRYVNNDTFAIHEELLLDMAAAVKFLRDRDFQHVVLIGHSGGGSLSVYYLSQAATAPPHRRRHTPAGDPPNLNEFTLPPADGLITMAAHRGRGWQGLIHLDPSVVDEEDPYATDPSLDMYSPANGFRTPPEPSQYSKEFLERFRAAQRDRMQRLIETAKARIQEQNRYRDLAERSEGRGPEMKQEFERRARCDEPIICYRTIADPRMTDLSLDPSDRIAKCGWGERPDLLNYSMRGNGHILTTRALLSSWSTASYAYIPDNITAVKVPTLIMQGTADYNGMYPEDTNLTYEKSGSSDKQLVWITGANHSFLPEGPKAGEGNQREQTTNAQENWIRERFTV